jgi:phosphoglycerol transferase
MTYADKASGGAFEQNVIPELTALAQQGEDFSGSDPNLNGGLVLPGTGWTMGGMFAQSCGVPLKLPIDGNSMDTQESFFPGISGIGNILAEQGYRQVLMLGSDATFGGRRLYYGEHGSFDIYDYNYASEQGFIPEGYKVFWGFEDERLFAWARQVLPELAAAEEPFNLTMLTVDTHFEDGWVCDLCGDEFGDDQYANVMACSSRQVSEFVPWLSQQDFWENTTVIISGDHTTMDKDFCENVPSTFQRRTLVSVINGAAEPEDPEATRTYSTLDLFPTTLAALGVKVQGDRLGLGTNLYGTRPTIVEQYGLDACRNALSGPSDFLASQ